MLHMDKSHNLHEISGFLNFQNDAASHQPETLHNILQSLNSELDFEQYLSEKGIFLTSGDLFKFGNSGFASVIGTPDWQLSDITKDKTLTHAELLVKMYKSHGNDFLNYLEGCFSFILYDNQKSRLIAAVDHLSRFPLFWSYKENRLTVASSAISMLAQNEVNTPELSNQGIYNFVYFHMSPSPGSVYKDINKLLAGHALIVENNQADVFRYWNPPFRQISKSSFSDTANELKKILRNSVEKCYADSKPTGAFLSGGLDSSTVAGMFSEIKNSQADAFAIGFSAEGYDEMEYARITAKHFDIKLHEYYVTPDDVVNALLTVACSYDEPFGNSSALPAYFCAKFAKESGMECLLAGDGGDEIFAGNERYLKQKVFENYHRIPKRFRLSIIESMVKALPSSVRIFHKVKRYIEQSNVPLPDRLQTYNFLHRHNADELFTDEFLSSVDTNIPLEYQQNIYHSLNDASSLNRMLYLDWQYTLADNDLRKVSHMCAISGIEVLYPMLDDELIDFSCRIPDDWKLKPSKLRYFYKEALRGWLPDQTITKKKQGFGLPFGVWMESHKPLRELAYDSLSKLKKRNILKSEFIDDLIRMHQGVHAAYYGELVWILTVLELWLEAHTSNVHQQSINA